MRRWADESVQNVFGEMGFGDTLWVPRVDVYETDESVVARICAPGVRADNMEISLTSDGRQLVLRGFREEDQEARRSAIRYHQLEIYTGPFERTVQLPPDIVYDRDGVAAVCRDGFFVVSVPKVKAQQTGPRSVPISSD